MTAAGFSPPACGTATRSTSATSIPSRPGLEVYGIHENEEGANCSPGYGNVRRQDRRVLWKTAQGEDVGRGLAADIDPRYPGCECWGGPGGLRTSKGERIGRAPRSANFAIWWDGDLLRETARRQPNLPVGLARTVHWRRSSPPTGCTANNGSKSTPCLSADLFGDWREEVIFRTTDNKSLAHLHDDDPDQRIASRP